MTNDCENEECIQGHDEKDWDVADECERDDHQDGTSVESWYSCWILGIGFLGHALYYGLTWTVGIYHVIFLDTFGQETGPTSWIGSINTASMYFFGESTLHCD